MENNQPLETQLVVPSNKNFFKILFFISTIIIFGLIATIYIISNIKSTNLQSSQTNSQTTSLKSTLTSYDSNNNIYTNSKYQLSLIIPKTVKERICQKTEDYYEFTSEEDVPLIFFEAENNVYFTRKYFYDGGVQIVIPAEPKPAFRPTNKYYSCQKYDTRIGLFGELGNANLQFSVYEANNDDELEQAIKAAYGSGCKLGEKTKTDKPDTYDIEILTDGKDPSQTECPIYFYTKNKFNQTKGIFVTFSLGQDCNIYKNGNCLDETIVNSLEFN